MTDEFRDMIERELVVERTGWAAERVQRVTERLQPGVAPGDRFETLVVWLEEHSAFTRDGRTHYISRRLLERLPDDDATAFVIAHETAHHRLGHLASSRWALPRRVAWGLIRELWISSSAERERDADLLAIEMCLDAGYDLERCLETMALLEQVSLDYGDVSGVVGDEHGNPRSHPPIRARVEAVRAHAEAVRRGHRFPVAEAAARERARRRQLARRAAVATAGSAAAIAGLVLIGRRPSPELVTRIWRTLA